MPGSGALGWSVLSGTMFSMRASALGLRARPEYHGWLIVAVVFLVAALAIGTSNYAFGLFVGPLEASFGWSRTAISASLSFAAVGSIASPLIGRLMDRYGARGVMVISLCVFGASFLLRPLITELWHLYLLSFFQFLTFSGAALLPAGRLVGIWFPHSRGRVMGIATVGNNFGGLTMPLLVGFVLTSATASGTETPWRAAFVVVAGVSFVLALAALVLVHENPGWVRGETSGRQPESRPRLTGYSLRDALRTRSFYAMTVVVMLASFTYSGVLPHVNAHLLDWDIPNGVVLTAVALLAACGMAGKLTFGYFAERFSARSAMMVSLAGQVLFISLMVAYPTQPAIWITVPLYGFFMGAYGVLVTLLTQDTFGLKAFGSITGLSQLATLVPMLAGPLLAGVSYDVRGSYGTAFMVVAALFVLAIFALSQVRAPRGDPFGGLRQPAR